MRFLLAAFMVVSAFTFAAWAEQPIGSIDFADGPFTLTRNGTAVSGPSIGDDIYDQDLISTGTSGSVTIALAKATGMGGTIKVAPESSLYLEVDGPEGQQHSQVELISGGLSLKLKKLAGSPTLAVATDTATMGVRGTEFEVTTSDNGDILVTCTEGEVACTDESGSSVSAVPGQTVEKQEGQRMQRRALAIAEYQKFKATWISNESAAFKRGAGRAAAAIAIRYLDLLSRFQSIHEELAANGTLRRWAEEEKTGTSAAGPELDSQLAEVGPRLREARRVLGAMMRITVRVDALYRVLKEDRAALRQPIRKGLSTEEFFNRFRAQRAENFQRQVWLMHALKLYRSKLALAHRTAQQTGAGGAAAAPTGGAATTPTGGAAAAGTSPAPDGTSGQAPAASP